MALRSLLPLDWNPWRVSRRELEQDPFFALHREMNRLFDEFSRGFGLPAAEQGASWGAASPKVDVSETDKEIQIAAELPGVEEKDIDVTLQDDVLTLRGEKKTEREEKEKDFHLMERSYGSFARSIRLPYAVDPEQVNASFRNGILKISLPKPAEAKEKVRKIAVRGEGGGERRVEAKPAGQTREKKEAQPTT